MHIRVLLSKYRAYTPCEACGGARLKPDALLWRLGTAEDSDRVLDPAQRFRPRGIALERRALRALAGIDDPRPRAAAGRARARILRAPHAAGAARRGDGPAARRDPRAPSLPRRRGPRLPHARSAVANAVGRRGPAHQPHHRARHLARQYAVRARRAVDRTASARHGPRHRGDAPAARRRQFARRRRARSAGDARRGPRARHGPRPGRARRRDRVLRHAGRAPRRRPVPHCRLSRRAQACRADRRRRRSPSTARASRSWGPRNTI